MYTATYTDYYLIVLTWCIVHCNEISSRYTTCTRLGYVVLQYVGGLQFHFGLSLAIHGLVSDCCGDVSMFGSIGTGLSGE